MGNAEPYLFFWMLTLSRFKTVRRVCELSNILTYADSVSWITFSYSVRVAICTATSRFVSPHALHCKTTLQCALPAHQAADDSLLQQLMGVSCSHETAIIQSGWRLRCCDSRLDWLQMLRCWLVPLVHMLAKAADPLLSRAGETQAAV